MSQSRGMSLVEAATNVVVGFGIALITQVLAFPALGIETTLRQNATLSALFTAVSLARGFMLRRVFNRVARRKGDADYDGTGGPRHPGGGGQISGGYDPHTGGLALLLRPRNWRPGIAATDCTMLGILRFCGAGVARSGRPTRGLRNVRRADELTEGPSP
jgi:hypothetical protein